jgi:5-formyltetrahydrofolate cyclo-ligase
MSADIREQKSAIRARVRNQLRLLSSVERAAAAVAVFSRLRGERVWREAETALLFSPLADEPDVSLALQDALTAGKALALPRFEEEAGAYVACRVTDPDHDLRLGRYGVKEPNRDCPVIPLNRLDFVAVPGVAFTVDGRRLGRGKGFYDRLLASVCGIKCGVAFDQQIVEHIPVEAHDIRLDYVLTPTRWCRVDRNAVVK